MMFHVTDDCYRLGLRAGAVLFRGLRVTESPDTLRTAISSEIESLRARFPDPRAVRSDPDVVRFQELLRRVGANPRKDQPSLERLLGFTLKRGDLPAINSLVDAYNLVSIRHGLSLGAHDLDRITVPVTLRLLDGSEAFTPLGREQAEAVTAGEYGYVDAGNRVLCRLDVLQAEFSKVTLTTTNALLIVEGTADHAAEVLQQALTEVAELVVGTCGGTAEVTAVPSP